LIREMKETLGIPKNYNQPTQYLSAAYALLVEGKQATISDTNRYTVHKQCADNGRDILLSMQKLDYAKTGDKEELETWLTLVETKVEAYRTAYRSLTGVDLGAPGTPTIEQQVLRESRVGIGIPAADRCRAALSGDDDARAS